MKKITLALGLLMSSVAVQAHAATPCETDKALTDGQFKIHPSEHFARLADRVIEGFINEGENFVYDTSGTLRSLYGSHDNQVLKLVSYDDITTPMSKQYGDVVFVFALDFQDGLVPAALGWKEAYPHMAGPAINRLVEVRWWEGPTRHLAYNSSHVRCAAHSIPMAVNALF